MTVATTKPAADGRGGRRYALLLALWDSEYAKKAYGGYYNVFVAAFGRAGGGAGDEGETWDCFRVIAGEFPAPEDLASYDGFVVSGSPHDAHGEEPWVRRLCALVQALHAMGKRVLGVCFGHQVLCRALGGTVGRARGGWDVGVKKVTFVQDSLEGLNSTASLIEVHQDEVWEVPPGATVLASSEKTRVEVFAVGEHALGIQGHPEYTTDTLHNLIDRLTAQGAIEARAGEDARRTVAETGGPDRAFWTGLCKAEEAARGLLHRCGTRRRR
ncbi:hypothetical protein SETIT_1G063900v2 [Setaria italica]|uniref:Glutamine amidotransferase domain-containing protein n=1 Tax=Setaria italica TaxID=4555 RepID=A0A368PJI3_SETIT|nr:hypothetical protein SETIT_1G063900v2 [Setaria italica]